MFPGLVKSDRIFLIVFPCRCRECYEEEEDLTLAELKSRPQGKADWSSRSHLHDDITVIILHFVADSSSGEDLAEKYTTVVEEAIVRNQHWCRRCCCGSHSCSIRY